MRSLLLLVLSVASTAHAAEPKAVCTWSGARWEQRATLYLSGTGLAFAEASPGDGVSLDGSLGFEGPGIPRFHVHLEGPHLQVEGDVSPNRDPLLHVVDAPVPLGAVGVVVPGGLVSVRGAVPGGVLIAPFRWAMSDVKAYGVVGVTPCEHLSVHWAKLPDEEAALQAAGFSPDLPVEHLRAHHGAPLAVTPGGPRVARIARQKWPVDLRVAGRQDAWAQVVLSNWTGTVWHGWIPERKLTIETEEGSKDGVLGGVLGGIAGHGVKVHTCTTPVPLHVRVAGVDAEVGTIAPGTPMHLESDNSGHLAVSFPGGWLYPAEHATFLVSEAAAVCPESTWTAPPISSVLQDAR